MYKIGSYLYAVTRRTILNVCKCLSSRMGVHQILYLFLPGQIFAKVQQHLHIEYKIWKIYLPRIYYSITCSFYHDLFVGLLLMWNVMKQLRVFNCTGCGCPIQNIYDKSDQGYVLLVVTTVLYYFLRMRVIAGLALSCGTWRMPTG